MKLALIGYGKMGKAIERLAKADGLEIVATIDQADETRSLSGKAIDVAIEFTQPTSAVDNIRFCLENGIKTISGTTGWQDQLPLIKEICETNEGTFLYASNFSIGVNLFFELNEWLAKKMASLDFKPELLEVHHTEKKDSPSGTAITLAEGILDHTPGLGSWINHKSADHQRLGIISERKPNVPGTHTVTYSSKLETIEMTHTAHDRNVFAEGVIKVAKWIRGQHGFLSMSDFINNQ